MHAISSYRGNRPTNTRTHKHTHINKQTHRQDRLPITITTPLSLGRSVITTQVTFLYSAGSWRPRS